VMMIGSKVLKNGAALREPPHGISLGRLPIMLCYNISLPPSSPFTAQNTAKVSECGIWTTFNKGAPESWEQYQQRSNASYPGTPIDV